MKPIDFQGLISPDLKLVEQVCINLQEKETELGKIIVNSVHPLPRESLPPFLPYKTQGPIRLSEAVEVLSQIVLKLSLVKRPIVPNDDWELAAKQVNRALWEYVEHLEGCAVELFQQLGQVGFEKWSPVLVKTVEGINHPLQIKLEELEWKLPRIEAILGQYRTICEMQGGRRSFFSRIFNFFNPLLNPSLAPYVRKSRKFLEVNSQKFSFRYGEYVKLKVRIEDALRKFSGYQVFKTIEEGTKEDFKTIYRLLKVWELNLRSKSLPPREPIRALRSAYSIERASQVFREYARMLRKALFDRSRKFKSDAQELYMDASSRRILTDVIKGYRAETHTLGVAIDKYREFYLRTHPDPYIRTRWGFAEWIVGPEPQQTKDLLTILYEAEELDKLVEHLLEGLKKGPSAYDNSSLTKLAREADRTIHEMGRPLTSRFVMRGKAEKLLLHIQQMDELGSFNPEVVETVGNAFSKALRADWQYQVLFDMPLFHQLFAIHQGILGSMEERSHLNRMHKFKALIGQIEGWVKNRDSHRHVHEIEADMMDMKGYLQDFFAHLQRIESGKELPDSVFLQHIREASRQLLEYRYLFGKFFYSLHQFEPEGRLIRNQFLFVDQYFESVESKLAEMKQNLDAKK